MRKEVEPTEIAERYAEAHLAHYGARDLQRAFDLYKAIISTHPDTQEAGYARSQVQNIVKSVVPKGDLFDAQVALLSDCLTRMSGVEAAAATDKNHGE